jgi:DNA-binding beta-propeller fold protein YncE
MKHTLVAAALALAAAGLALGRPAGGDGEARMVLVAGGGSEKDGAPATEAQVITPFGMAFDRLGQMFIVELEGGRVRRIDRRGILTTVAGTGEKGDAGDGGPALAAKFNSMHSLAMAPGGAVFLADTLNNRIRKFDPETGRVTAFAGTGQKGFSGDGGPATQAQFGGVYCVALDPAAERIYLADLDNRRVRAIDLKSGVVTTVAGNGQRGVPEDGAEARSSPLVDPRAVAADGSGNLYILERSGHALRVVDRNGRIRTVAGTGNVGATGDGGDARQATLNGPKHLCIDRDGSVVIADTENHLIRRYLPREGKIVRVAGCGRKGTAGVGGPPEQAELNQPHGVAIGPSGELYIADSTNNRVLKIAR